MREPCTTSHGYTMTCRVHGGKLEIGAQLNHTPTSVQTAVHVKTGTNKSWLTLNLNLWCFSNGYP